MSSRNTGKKAVVSFSVEVLVEVPEMDDDSYNTIVERAKDDLRKRVVEAPTFLPISFRSERVYAQNTTVRHLRESLIVEPRKDWFRR